jgi:hypothetical protein
MGEATRPHLRFQQTSTPPTCRSGYGSSRLASKNVCAPAAAQDGRPKTKSLLNPVVMATQQLAGCGANRPLKSRHVPQASVFPHRLLRRRSREPTLECNANHSGRSRALHSRHLARHCRAGGNYRTVAWVGRNVARHMAQEQELVSAMAAPGATGRSLQIQLRRLDVCF